MPVSTNSSRNEIRYSGKLFSSSAAMINATATAIPPNTRG